MRLNKYLSAPFVVIKNPAFLFILVGLVIYVGTILMPEPPPDFYSDAVRPEIKISAESLSIVQQEYAMLAGRPLAPDEERKIIKWSINQEVLHDYAIRLGVDSTEAARVRLARIGEFLRTEHTEHPSKDDLIEKARDLGMANRDPVIRKILIDSVTRLIKAGVLVQPIDENEFNAWYEVHKARYRLPPKTRISHVLLAQNVDNRSMEELELDARVLLSKIKSDNLTVNEAIELGDEMFVPSHFNLITNKDYDRQLGYQFSLQLDRLPVGQWSGPVVSRYGQHLVYVHERADSIIPELAQVRNRAVNDYRQHKANMHLEARLDELRKNYDVYVNNKPWVDEEKGA